METVNISDEIKKKIKCLEKGRATLDDLGTNRANSIGEYEKEIAKTIIMLKNGKEFEIEGEKICSPVATITEKLAKGLCSELKIKMETADSLYKIAFAKMKAVEAELNGYQSINRHLSEI